MEIVSFKFALLAILSALVYNLLNPRYRIAYLSILSCGFIATYSYYLLIYILLYSIINYYLGLKIPGSGNKKLLYRIGIFINLSQLILLKYSSFAIDPVFQLFNSNTQVSLLSRNYNSYWHLILHLAGNWLPN